ncbi:Protein OVEREXPRESSOR OF CATIONIC PEROXIDASE 3 [Hibiscus syriacus]|uniref:Protein OVEREXPRESSOR OF CATIONIC PEROXIDASE 3 n=1 Tax=Hibiscus syriacus TaxID=106335 RepID=A0A6A3A536_HIBSY|nr:Protein OVEREXPRESSOR OF CATIONIC PEROXIDASE 3 [Hibiscus syriacus]
MASALSLNSSMCVRLLLPSSCRGRVSIIQPRAFSILQAHQPRRRSTLAFARRRSKPPVSASSAKKNRVKKEKKRVVEEEDFEADPFEALFNQLEEDLKNDNSDRDEDDDDDEGGEIKEEDIERLANELAEALGDFDFEGFTSTPDDAEEEVEDEDDEEKKSPVKLKNWQLRRLATALKVGRRKTSIKTLAAELCLDRAVVLELLREPPPELLMMSATLPDEPVKREPELVPEIEHIETEVSEITMESVKHEPKVKEPVHVMQQRWSAQKRLKKVHVETLEKFIEDQSGLLVAVSLSPAVPSSWTSSSTVSGGCINVLMPAGYPQVISDPCCFLVLVLIIPRNLFQVAAAVDSYLLGFIPLHRPPAVHRFRSSMAPFSHVTTRFPPTPPSPNHASSTIANFVIALSVRRPTSFFLDNVDFLPFVMDLDLVEVFFPYLIEGLFHFHWPLSTVGCFITDIFYSSLVILVAQFILVLKV